MRKTLIIALMALGVMSCAREEEWVNVRFGYGDIEKGSMTRVADDTSIQDAINGSLPTDIVLDLCEARTKEHYKTTIGKEVMIPAGRYLVTGDNESMQRMTVGNNEISTTPRILISQDVDVVSTKTDYSVSAKFNCFAIVVDYREIESMTIEGQVVDFYSNGNYGIVYVNRFSNGMNVTVTPKGGTHNEAKTFYFSNKNVDGYVYCQNGYYYLVHPKIVQLIGMVFGLDLKPMIGQDVK